MWSGGGTGHTHSDVGQGEAPGGCRLPPDLGVGDGPKCGHESSGRTLVTVTGGSAASCPRNRTVARPPPCPGHLLAPLPAAPPGTHSLSTAAPAALRPPAPPPLLCRRGRPGCLKRSDSRGGFEEKNMVLKTQNTQRVSARGKYRNRGAWRGGHRALLAWAVPTGKCGLVTKLQALRGPRARDPIGCHGAEGKLRPGESGPRGQSAPRDRPPRLRRLRAGFPGCHPCFRAAGLP